MSAEILLRARLLSVTRPERNVLARLWSLLRGAGSAPPEETLEQVVGRAADEAMRGYGRELEGSAPVTASGRTRTLGAPP